MGVFKDFTPPKSPAPPGLGLMGEGTTGVTPSLYPYPFIPSLYTIPLYYPFIPIPFYFSRANWPKCYPIDMLLYEIPLYWAASAAKNLSKFE